MDEIDNIDEVTRRIIGGAIEVHRSLGPGLPASVYEQCLAYEIGQRGLRAERQVEVGVRYKDTDFNLGYRLGLLVQEQVVVEVKTVECLLISHEAQLITYLKHSGKRIGLLLNFDCPTMKEGIRRFELG